MFQYPHQGLLMMATYSHATLTIYNPYNLQRFNASGTPWAHTTHRTRLSDHVCLGIDQLDVVGPYIVTKRISTFNICFGAWKELRWIPAVPLRRPARVPWGASWDAK